VTGKRPGSDGLGLLRLGLTLTDRGYISVDETEVTSLPHIFSAGDMTGGLQFTHTAHPAGDVAGYNAAMVALEKKDRRKTDLSVVPRVTFLEMEVASVGLTEEEAKVKYKTLFVGSFQVASLGRAVTDGGQTGFVKLVADGKTGKLVGGHVVADRAGEMIHEVALAIKLGAKMEDLAEMIHAFPTYSEVMGAAASNAKRK